jgi:diguanylate cyclase (GGDEF)-like protein
MMTLELEKRALEVEKNILRVQLAQREATIADIKHLANTDPLTGLLNRRGATEQINRLIRQAARSGDEIVVLALDADHFKSVNEVHGHATGDLGLQHIAHALTTTFIRPEDITTRLGGEEFAAIIRAPAGQGDAVGRMMGEKLRKNTEQNSVGPENNKHPLTVSVGMRVFNAEDMMAEVMLFPRVNALADALASALIPSTKAELSIKLKRAIGDALDSRFQIELSAADRAGGYAKHNGRNCVAAFPYGDQNPEIISRGQTPSPCKALPMPEIEEIAFSNESHLADAGSQSEPGTEVPPIRHTHHLTRLAA